MIGLFAITEAFVMLEAETILTEQGRERMRGRAGPTPGTACAWLCPPGGKIIWTSFIGLPIGALPGAGASIASFVYQQSRFFSRTLEVYVTGHPEGVTRARIGQQRRDHRRALVPLVTLGIPGGSTAAVVMLIVLQYHGMPLGPKLFIEPPEMAYGVIMAMVVSYMFSTWPTHISPRRSVISSRSR